MSLVLLDTCALIWLVNGDLDDSEARPRLVEALQTDGLMVSATSAWEIGLLSRPPARIQFLPDPKTWFQRILARPGLRLAAITPEIAIDSSHLPGELHGDPADRLIIATARHLNAPVVTRDRRMIEYADAGFIRLIRC